MWTIKFICFIQIISPQILLSSTWLNYDAIVNRQWSRCYKPLCNLDVLQHTNIFFHKLSFMLVTWNRDYTLLKSLSSKLYFRWMWTIKFICFVQIISPQILFSSTWLNYDAIVNRQWSRCYKPLCNFDVVHLTNIFFHKLSFMLVTWNRDYTLLKKFVIWIVF